MNYTLARHNNDSGRCPFSVPSNSLDPAADWGPAPGDARHTGSAMIMAATLPHAVRVMAIAAVRSATPYNITTGFDDNHDTVINDRPAGVGRNSARGWASSTSRPARGGPLALGSHLRPASASDSARRSATPDSGRDAIPLGTMSAFDPQARRCRIELYAQVFNLFNRVNQIGYRGVRTSPFFGTPTAALPPRRIEIGARLDF